jgi:hypothetical protein
VNLSVEDSSVPVLRNVLEKAVQDLHYEIADTDNPEYKRGLKDQVDTLQSMLNQIPTTG